MDQCEDREEGAPPSKTTLCGQHESQTKAQRTGQGSEINIPENIPDCLSVTWNSPRNRNSKETPPSFAIDTPQSSNLEELDRSNNNMQDS